MSMTEQKMEKSLTPSYLYPVRVELSQPISRGGWKTTEITYVVTSLSHIEYHQGILKLYRDGQSRVNIPEPVLWQEKDSIKVPTDKIPPDAELVLETIEGKFDGNGVLATWWTPDGKYIGSLLASGKYIT